MKATAKVAGANPPGLTIWSTTAKVTATWFGTGKPPTHPPNPAYPDGKDVDGRREGEAGCGIKLQVPAPNVGHWLVQCGTCGIQVAVTAAGRPDDPRNVIIPCGPMKAPAGQA